MEQVQVFPVVFVAQIHLSEVFFLSRQWKRSKYFLLCSWHKYTFLKFSWTVDRFVMSLCSLTLSALLRCGELCLPRVMMLSHLHCLSESLAHSKLLNVNTEPSHALFAVSEPKLQRLDCHYTRIAFQVPQDGLDALGSTRLFQSHIAGPFCRSTAVCYPAVDTLVAQHVAALLRRSHDVPSAIHSNSLSAVMLYSASTHSTYSWSIPILYPASVFTGVWPRHFECFSVTS